MTSKVGKRYALSVLEAAGDQKKVGELLTDFALIHKALTENKHLLNMLKSPIVRSDKKNAVLEGIFTGKVQPLTLLLLHILTHKGRVAYLPEIMEGFKELLDEQNGIETIEVQSPFEMNTIQSEELRKKLEGYTSKKVQIQFSLDKQMIGGLKIKIGDTVIDGSVRHKLEMLKATFTADILN
jgi:F-type H+-transporting ATPase subunit delta